MLRKVQLTLDTILTVIGSILMVCMFVVITVNVILRLIPSIGGFSWYMEFSQYANVWGMLLGAAGVACMGTNLRVELIDSFLNKSKLGHKITRLLIDAAELVFYIIMTYSGYLLATKAKQKVSTMPSFTMGQVYWIFVIAGVVSIIAVLIHAAVVIQGKDIE